MSSAHDRFLARRSRNVCHRSRRSAYGVPPDAPRGRRINAQGDVAGRATAESGEPFGGTHAVVWLNGDIYDLNELVDGEPNVVLHNAYDINDNGLNIATGNVDGIPQSFLLEPGEA